MDKKMKYTAIIDADTKHFMKKSKKVMKRIKKVTALLNENTETINKNNEARAGHWEA